jgi:creatinine amidohydrolase
MKKEKVWFDELTMEEAEQAAKSDAVIIFPVGSVEEHGVHLPLCTDSIQPEYIAQEAAKETKALIAPPLRYGVCNSTRNFPGTISIQFETLHAIAKDILEEFIRNGFTKFLILSGHAGQSHMAALRLAAQQVIWNHQKQRKQPRIIVCSDYDFAYELKGKYFDEKDGHAGAIETSRVKAIKPDLARTKAQRHYSTMPRFEVLANPETYFPAGIIGDPTAATTRKGQMTNKYVTEQTVRLIEELKK